MAGVLAAIGLLIKHPVVVANVIMLEHLMRRNAYVTVGRLPRDGK
jgi:hypothetical protein